MENKTLLLSDNIRSKKLLHVIRHHTEYKGCQCYHDCSCPQDFKPHQEEFWKVSYTRKSGHVTKVFFTYEKALHFYTHLFKQT